MFGRRGAGAGARPSARRRRWLEFTGLADRADALPDELEPAPAQVPRAGARAGLRPRLVLLDEVLSGLTPARSTTRSTDPRIRDQGATIVFVEHVMRAVMALTDRVVVLDHGRCIAEGAPPR